MAVDQFQNAYVTKLRQSCTTEQDVLYVDEPPMITQGTLTLEFSNQTKREIIHFTGVDGYKLTGVTRGCEDTIAQSHSVGSDVRQNVTAGMLDLTNIGTDRIIDHAVTASKIDKDTIDWYPDYKQKIAITTQQGAINFELPLPADDKKFAFYRIQGYFWSNGASPNGGWAIGTNNTKTDTAWSRRFGLESSIGDHRLFDENPLSTSDMNIMYLTRNDTAATGGSGLNLTATFFIEKYSNGTAGVRGIALIHTMGSMSTLVCSTETAVRTSDVVKLKVFRTNGTCNGHMTVIKVGEV